MEVPDLLALFAGRLETAGIAYMVTGGVAATVYGEPRFTRDVDLVVELDDGAVPALLAAFDPDDFYVPPLESLHTEARRSRGGHFNLIHRDTTLRADVYVRGDDPLHSWAFERRRRFPVNEYSVWLAPPEYVITRKLQYHQDGGSERHLDDVAGMARVSSLEIDLPALERLLEEYGLLEAWRSARDRELGT